MTLKSPLFNLKLIKNQSLHKNSFHNHKYDFEVLQANFPALVPFVFTNDYHSQTINFSDPQAVKALNSALLKTYYHVDYWQFPDENLCPPIPGRADYLHHLSDLLRRHYLEKNSNILDIGVGASCIYPLLGNALFNWKFVGSDIDEKSLDAAQRIIDKNNLSEDITLRLQTDYKHILTGVIKPMDKFTASVCNPPFYKSQAEALDATKTKLKGLGKESGDAVRNFSGTPKELCYAGGEKAFLHTYLYESSQFKNQCFWYTSLVSNVGHVKSMQESLKKLGATDIQVIDMIQGNKISRIVAWTFLTALEQQEWHKN